VERVSSVVATLRRCSHSGFPVIGQSGEGESTIIGIMLRSHLMALLRTKK
jgi:chloride channel 7